MHMIKGTIKNTTCPEGCIAEAYLNSEVTQFCAMYFRKDIEHHMNRLSRNEVGFSPSVEPAKGITVFSKPGHTIGKSNSHTLTRDEAKRVHLYIMLNCAEVEMFLRYIRTLIFLHFSAYILFVQDV